MSFTKYRKRHAYRWHRVTSLVVAVPVLLWTISGFLNMHHYWAKTMGKNVGSTIRNVVLTAYTLGLLLGGLYGNDDVCWAQVAALISSKAYKL